MADNIDAISHRQLKEKELLLEQLRKTPIIQIACEKTGVGRATFYRWKREDKEFAKEADEAVSEGSLYINDLAESQLLSAIRDKNLSAIFFWLKTHHPTYANRLEINGKLQHDFELTAEQEGLIAKALKMVIRKESHEKEKE